VATVTRDRPARLNAGLILAVTTWGATVVAASTSGALDAMARAFMPAYAGLVA
jgi:hypothetical protein